VRSTAIAHSGRGNRTVVLIAVGAALALSVAFAARPSVSLAFTAGDNGHPTNGPYTDLKGGMASFTFQANATLTCDADTATRFHFFLDYNIVGTLPAGAKVVIYLSPNQGAINNNANGDAASYVAAVESNYKEIGVGGLSGSGTLEFNVPVTTAFQLSGGGVLGVIASEAGENGQSWTSKTNSLNCSEAEGTPNPTPSPTPSATPAQTPSETPGQTPAQTPAQTPVQTPEGSVAGSTSTPSPEQSVQGGTGTPAPSQPDTAMGANGGSSPIPTVAFGLILLAALGTLAWVNIRSARSRA
jgi:hypothetical protein